MGIVERYKLYVEDLANAILHNKFPELHISIVESEDGDYEIMLITGNNISNNLITYHNENFELVNDSHEDEEKWYNYLETNQGIHKFINTYSVNEGTIYDNIITKMLPFFTSYCSLRAASHVLIGSEFELAENGDGSFGNLSELYRDTNNVYSVEVSRDCPAYIARIKPLETIYRIQRKDDSSN